MVKKWEQKLNLKEGALHRALGIPQDKKIPLNLLQGLKKKLMAKSKKGKLSPGERTLLKRVTLAITFKTQ